MAPFLLLSLWWLSTAVRARGVSPHLADEFQSNCAALSAGVEVSTGNEIQVNFARYVPAGTTLDLAADGVNATCGTESQVVSVDLCRLAMQVSTSDSSEVTMEAWLPRNYSGRFLSTGNGGLGGCIQYEDLAYTAARGFSAVATNNGHNGTSGGAFFNQPEVITDFAWRALYTGVVVGKDITDQFYAEKHSRSYYLGCSTGGRQGFKMVQQFPDLFDGVVAGAPAFDFSALIDWSINFYRILGNNESSTFLSTEQWAAVHGAILDQCDQLDGAVDGILEDPDMCQPDPSPLLCGADSNSTTCLTPTQADSVCQVFSPVVAGDTFIYPRMNPGSELTARYLLYNGVPFPYSADWFQYVIYNSTSWDPASFSLDDALACVRANPSNIETFSGDLSAFRDHGAKVLHYHGLADFLISSDNSERYYELVSQTMGASPAELDEFYRYFRIAGMGHCSGGNGAFAIGQSLGSVAGEDPEDNVLARIVDWVENGNAPETVRGTNLVDGEAAFSRKHCKYPLRNVYTGTGDGTDEAGWNCVAKEDS